MTYTPPSTAVPFTLSIPDSDLNDLFTLLRLSPLGPQTWENTHTDTEDYGVSYKWLSEAKDHWLNKFSWRDQEAYINSFPNYKSTIEGLDIHFVGLFSQRKDAIPICFMHGWPGSFLEFLPLLGLVRKQYEGKDLPYHLIVPSLPGFTLSGGPPVDRDWTSKDSARVLHKLVVSLGFNKYIVQGGDVGSFLARMMTHEYDEVVGQHLNMYRSGQQLDPEKLTAFEKESLKSSEHWVKLGSAYAMTHGTRPSSIGHVLSASPLALLAWIGDKFVEWSDESPSLDDILTSISLYWLTSSFPRSVYPYRAFFRGNPQGLPQTRKPTGFSFFPKELAPGVRYLLEEETNLVSYGLHESGGHFAALEKPAELWADVEEFVGKAWVGDGGKL